MWPVLKTFAHNYVGPLSALPADSIEGMSKTPLLCQPIGSLAPSLIKAQRLQPVLTTFAHNYVGQGCTLSALPAHLIGGMSDTPVPRQLHGSLAPSLIKVERLWPVLKTFTHNYVGQGCTLSALPAHLIGGMSETPVLPSAVLSPVPAWVLSSITNKSGVATPKS